MENIKVMSLTNSPSHLSKLKVGIVFFVFFTFPPPPIRHFSSFITSLTYLPHYYALAKRYDNDSGGSLGWNMVEK